MARTESLDTQDAQSCIKCLQRAAKDEDAAVNHSQSLRDSLAAPTTTTNGLANAAEVSQGSTALERPPEQQQHTQTFVQDAASNAGQQLNPLPQEPYFDGTLSSFGYPGVDPFDLFGDGDTILENVDFSSLFLQTGFALDQGFQDGNRVDINENSEQSLQPIQAVRSVPLNEGHVEQSSISRFGSPLPSIRPEQHSHVRPPAERHGPCWKVSSVEYGEVKQKLTHLMTALPKDFKLPSKHSLSRFLEGCVKGLFEHMPLLHIPSWSISSAEPDLILAMAAIGAQFKFESRTATALFYAAKAAIMYQLHTCRGAKVIETIPQAQSLHAGSNVTSPMVPRDVQMRNSGLLSNNVQSDSREFYRLQTMQAIICLMVLGSWGPQQLVGEAIAFQSLLAELVREDGLRSDADCTAELASNETNRSVWLKWIRQESRRRTKLMAYTFINLQSVAYNVPPCMLTSEIQSHTPASQEEWNAKSADLWLQARQSSTIPSTPFADAFRSLFRKTGSGSATPGEPSSAVGNYALIFAILQCIYLLREGCATVPTAEDTRKLRSEDVDSLGYALQNWQSRWENSPESTIDPQSSSGPVAFNSTALLRLAWIRLHSDLGPCRNLASRNPTLIVEAFKSCPPLHRHPGLTLALLHAAHALSVPVRLGVNYVAKTQTLSWSVQHSLCNLECAVFLSKWFEAVASTIAVTPLTSQEMGIIHLIRSIVQETGFFRDEAFAPAADEPGWQTLIRHLGTAVACLWAEVFSGSHLFDMVSTIGASLNIYAKLLEDAHTPINGNIQP